MTTQSDNAWLRAMPTPESDGNKAREAARVAYEGGFVTGERDQSAYLARAFRTFEELWSEGEFRELAERLLRPVQAAIHAGGDSE